MARGVHGKGVRLIQCALGVLDGVELAVASTALFCVCSDPEDDSEEMATDPPSSTTEGGEVSIRLSK